jgi:hypothetical protein
MSGFSKKKIGEADLPTLASMNGDIVSVTGSASTKMPLGLRVACKICAALD